MIFNELKNSFKSKKKFSTQFKDKKNWSTKLIYKQINQMTETNLAFYEFTSDDFKRAVDEKLFISGVKLAIENNFDPQNDEQFYRGSKELLEQLGKLERQDYWDVLSKFPLAYISNCEDVKKYEIKYGKGNYMTQNVQFTTNTRQDVIKKSYQ